MANKQMNITRREYRVVCALAGMYEQYCPGRLGHNFMGAGEEAAEVLEWYGLIKGQDELDTDAVEEFAMGADVIDLNQVKERNLADMSLDERIDEIVLVSGLDRTGTAMQAKAIKRLFREMLNEIKPEKNPNAYPAGKIVLTKDGRLDAHEAARWAATDFNRAIDEMETKAKELGLD